MLNTSKINPIAQELFRQLEKENIQPETAVWAYTGAKRCSYAPIRTERFRTQIETIDLVLGDFWICQKDWTDPIKLFHYPDNLMYGIFLDIPRCCAAKYSSDVLKYDLEFKSKFSFRDFDKEKDEPKQYEKEINEHLKKNSYWEGAPWKSRDKEVLQMVSQGNLPQSLFLLKGHTYVPCQVKCPNFIEQSNNMLQALELYLPKSVQWILERYAKTTLENKHH